MNKQVARLDTTSEFRILNDDEIDLVNGGSFWGFVQHFLLGTVSLVAAFAFAIAGTAGARGQA